MIRLLLTLLALMSGLAVASGPASACACGGAGVEVGAPMLAAAGRVSAQVLAHGAAMAQPGAPRRIAAALRLPDFALARVPVMTGSDRARI